MKIACNYYLETEQLFDEGSIDLDYFKYPGEGFHMGIMDDLDVFEAFCDNLTAKRPILLHGVYPAPHDLASPSLQANFNDKIVNRLIKITKTPGLSFHPTLSQLPNDVPFVKTLGTIIDNAVFIKEKYSDMDFVAIENVDTIRWGDLIKPENITQLINETECDFLLDIGHAFCASRAIGEDFRTYLSKLPLQKVSEIHINGWVETDNDIMGHLKINDLGYQILKELLNECSPQIITIEYGRDYDRIGLGCPLMAPDKINDDAKKEIVEQISKIKKLV